MLDIGWTEFLVIGIVLIVVVGPKDLPLMLKVFGRMLGNLRRMAGELHTQFDQVLRETEMDEVCKTIADAQKLNPANALRDVINPLWQMEQEDICNNLEKFTWVDRIPETEKLKVEAQKAVEDATSAEPPAFITMPAASHEFSVDAAPDTRYAVVDNVKPAHSAKAEEAAAPLQGYSKEKS